MPELAAADFADLFGTDPSRFDEQLLVAIGDADFSYRILHGEPREQQIIQVLERLFQDSQQVGSPGRKQVWERGWAENLEAYLASGGDPRSLVPKFIRPNQAMRLRQDYVVSGNARFELDFIDILRQWLFKEFLAPHRAVYEFGCGTGFNLLTLNQVLPGKQLFGLDFVPSSVKLVNAIGAQGDIDLSGRLFDFTAPDHAIDLLPGCAVFTFGALEQVAGRFEPFLQYLLEKKPALVLHVEPTIELYDRQKLVDKLAILFHEKRGYTQGLLPRLQQLAREQRIDLLKAKRTGFGSLMLEGYTVMAWRPL